MEYTTSEIAKLIGGHVVGDEKLKISALAKIQEGTAGSITFLSNPKYENFLYSTNASAVIISKDYKPKNGVKPTLILVEDPYIGFTTLLEEYHSLESTSKKGIEEPSFIGENTMVGENIYRGFGSYIGKNCQIGDNVKIYPNVYVGDNVTIADNTIIYSGVKIYRDTIIGKHCIIHSGTVVGSDGFGFAPQTDGTYKAIPQLGNVVIEENVSIGANTTVDRATMGSTIIRKGVKLDNLIQIGHNVEIGENTVIAAQTGVSGSVKIGKNCIIAGQVGFAGHLEISDNTRIGAQSGIARSIKESSNTIFQGSPAFDYHGFMKSSLIFRKLPEMKREIEKIDQIHSELTQIPDLQKRIEELEEKILTLSALQLNQ